MQQDKSPFAKCTLELPQSEPTRRLQISTTVIKLNNFAQWASSGCVLPYLSVYFLHYTKATPNHVGVVMLVSALLGILVSFLFSCLADRYRAHRLAYLCSLLVSYVSYLTLLVPIIVAGPAGGQNSAEQLSESHSSSSSSSSSSSNATTHLEADDGDGIATTQTKLTLDLDEPIWFYVICVCVALGNMSSSINMSFSDSFSTNAARLKQAELGGDASEPGGHSSFGSLRFFGSIGWCLASFSLSIVNALDGGRSSYLLPGWLMFAALATFNILLVAFWPDARPFDLAESEPDDSNSIAMPPARQGNTTLDARFGLAFGSGCNWRLAIEGQVADGCTNGISLIRKRVFDFDTTSRKQSQDDHDHNYGQLNSSCESSSGRMEKIELRKLNGLMAVKQPQPQQPQQQQQVGAELEHISLKLYLKIIQLIARRNSNMLRFMFLYVVIGFVISMNWIYLFPYLEQLDGLKFRTLSAYVMISSYLSETLFYYVSRRITRTLSAANGLSLVLGLFSVRYALYLSLQLSTRVAWWPLELIVLVELLQSVSQGWFECVFNESALEFALEAERCVPQLIELRLIPNTRQSIERVKSSVKLTLFSLSSACFEGLGVGLGSLLGGWLIGEHGFCALWTSCASLALAVCLLNIFLELVGSPAAATTATTMTKEADGHTTQAAQHRPKPNGMRG